MTTTHMQVVFPGGKRADALLPQHVVHTDQSPEHGGTGTAPEPLELFLAALATCAGVYVLSFCQTRSISTEGLSLSQESVWEDGRLQEVRIGITLPDGFPEKYEGAIRAAANACRVKKLLADPPRITVASARQSVP
jgi:putative redox protein